MSHVGRMTGGEKNSFLATMPEPKARLPHTTLACLIALAYLPQLSLLDLHTRSLPFVYFPSVAQIDLSHRQFILAFR